MGGMPPNINPGVIEPGQRQTINPMFINPNQRTFQSFNPNLPSNMYGNVTTGRSDYQNSPYFISPEGTTPVVTQVATPQVIYNPNQQIQDRVANNRTEVDSIVAAGNGSIAPVPNILDASQSDELYNQNFQENFKAAQDHADKNPYGQTTGTPLSQQGFTTGQSLLPPTSTPPPTSGGGADGVGQFGAVGDFFGGIGDAIGVTNYAEQAETPEAKARAKSESDSGTSGGK